MWEDRTNSIKRITQVIFLEYKVLFEENSIPGLMESKGEKKVFNFFWCSFSVVRRHVENIETEQSSWGQQGMEVLSKEHAMKIKVILCILGKALLPANEPRGFFAPPALLIIIKVNIKSMHMNWVVQQRLGTACVRERRSRQPPVVSPPVSPWTKFSFLWGSWI